MGITTKKITKNLRKDISKNLEPILLDLRRSGYSDRQLEAFVIKHARMKMRHEYQKRNDFQDVRDLMRLALDDLAQGRDGSRKTDSQAEVLFQNALFKEKIHFEYHRKIGPYMADFVIDGALVVELDGPLHGTQQEHDEKRDNYMEKLGYKILRIPLNLFVLDSKATMESIKEARELI